MVTAQGSDPNKHGANETTSNATGTELIRQAISPEERLSQIRNRAYYYSLGRGQDEDQALDDWLKAERDVDRELAKGRQ
jgi:hypothetical protein